MMKTLDDLFADYRQNIERFRSNPLHRHHIVGVSQNLKNDVLLFTEDGGRIKISEIEIMDAAWAFTGERNVVKLALNSFAEHEQLF